jgi:Flp pilus assembly protein TadG
MNEISHDSHPVICAVSDAGAGVSPSNKPRGPSRGVDPGGQRGVVSLLFALLLPVLLALGAFLIDYPYALVMRQQMQVTADAAALAGARYLYEGGTPNWTQAADQTVKALSLNAVNNATMQADVAEAGYWNATTRLWQSASITPTVWDIPAVRVQLSKAVGHNDGEVKTLFAALVGVTGWPVSVSAIAGRTSPSTLDPGMVFPVVMSQCMFDKFWNPSTNPPGPKLDPSTGKPYVFQLGTKTYLSCASGEWTSLNVDSNSTSVIQNLIAKRNPIALSIGDLIWIEPGSKTTLNNSVNGCSAAGDKTCQYVLIPLAVDITTHAHNPITGFACIQILRAVGGSSGYIEVQMSTQCPTPSSSGMGSGYGVLSPPALFQ